ncbi:MAG: acetylornithine transaminase [Mariprofundaceae bacterium]
MSDALMDNYARWPLDLVRGEGSRVWDADGRSYLDFTSGIAVNALGHAHPALAEALCAQAREMLHCSNLFGIPVQRELARRLAALSGLDRAFFCNSGAESNEAAIKLARKYWADRGRARRTIVCMEGSFHGRTLATLTATGQDKVKSGFDPLPEGFVHVSFGDADALRRAVGDDAAAVLFEPIQGEGGVRPADPGFLREARAICDETGALLILDEVQTGVGRTGAMFAFEHAGIRPDVLTLAKSLGGGMPIGAMLAAEDVAASFGPGSHGSTFGGNPLACRAALTVLEVIESEGLVENARRQGARLADGLRGIAARDARVTEVRGAGLLLGMALETEAAPIIEAARTEGLLLLSAGPNVVRLLPPLNVRDEEIDAALSMLAAAMEKTA